MKHSYFPLKFKYRLHYSIGGEEVMSLILGMDTGVFVAWIGTIFAAVLCVLYGVYYHFKQESEENKKIEVENKKIREKQEK
jgi:hypothetical protein